MKEIQQRLKNWGYYTGEVDGSYGAQTEKAVKYFQEANGLEADGVVGPKTLSALGIAETGNATQQSNDAVLIARIISAEARASPTQAGGHRAVILNGLSTLLPQHHLGGNLSAGRLFLPHRRPGQPAGGRLGGPGCQGGSGRS